MPCAYEKEFRYLDTQGASFENIEKKVKWKEGIKAPVKKGDTVGTVNYYLDGKEIGSVKIICTKGTKQAQYSDCVKKVWESFLKKIY